MTDKELLQQALDALEMSHELQDIGWVDFEAYKFTCDADILNKLDITIKSIKARLAQPEPKPVAKSVDGWITWITNPQDGFPQDCFLYTAPPKKEWVGLTDEEIKKLSDDCVGVRDETEFMRAIEAKLKEKNGN